MNKEIVTFLKSVEYLSRGDLEALKHARGKTIKRASTTEALAFKRTKRPGWVTDDNIDVNSYFYAACLVAEQVLSGDENKEKQNITSVLANAYKHNKKSFRDEVNFLLNIRKIHNNGKFIYQLDSILKRADIDVTDINVAFLLDDLTRWNYEKMGFRWASKIICSDFELTLTELPEG